MKQNKEERRHSLGKRAALTGMVGAAFLHNPRVAEKLGQEVFTNRVMEREEMSQVRNHIKTMSKEIPRISRTIRAIADDIGEMGIDSVKHSNLTSLIEKHLLGEGSTYRRIAQETEKIALKTTGENSIAAAIRLKEIEKNPDTILRKVFNTEFSKKVTQELASDYNLKKDDPVIQQIQKLANHVVEKNNLILEHLDDNNRLYNYDMADSFMKFEKLGLTSEEKDSFLDKLYSKVNTEVRDSAYQEFKDSQKQGDDYKLIKELTDKFTGKSFEESFNSSKEDKLNKLGYRNATWQDYIDNSHQFKDQFIQINEDDNMNIKDIVQELMAKDERFKNVSIDAKNIKIDSNNNIVNLQEINDMKDKALRGTAGTLPGKIFKVTDILSTQEPGAMNYFSYGKAAPLISSTEGNAKHLENDYIQVLGKFYRVDARYSKLHHEKELDGMYVASSRHGTLPRMINKMFGLENEVERSGKWANRLDLGRTDEPTVIQSAVHDRGSKGKIARKIFGGTEYNIIDRMLDEDILEKDDLAYRKNLKKVSKAFGNITHVPSKSTLEKMSSSMSNKSSKDILLAIQMNDPEEMIVALNKLKISFNNEDLGKMINKSIKNRDATAKTLSITNNKLSNSKHVLNQVDLIKREAFKQALINEAVAPHQGAITFSKIVESIEKSNLKHSEKTNALNIAHWGVMQWEGGLHKQLASKEEIKEANRNVFNMIAYERKRGLKSIPQDADYLDSFQSTLAKMKMNYKDLTTKTDVAKDVVNNVIRGEENNPNLVMRKAYKANDYVLDMIRDMNDVSKMKANSKKFGMQFIAGRNSPEYVTTYTMAPYFLAARLAEPFAKYGLGMSNDSHGDVLNLSKNIFTKRILPVAAGITALSYANFEAKNLTGTSITGAMAQGIGNVDLGLRKIADKTGIGHLLGAERAVNPLTQYWLGNDYQDYDERKDYYENGYDAMRKSRWWAFGSASEFRGGKIAYFQPNFVKRATSDWKDIGLYGSVDNKWKHSWIPTLRHPFAPIRRALNPYWLEEMHYNDRPYMETAPLFSTGTPWGAVLNPTVGQIVKPIRRMHRNETRFGITDPRTLIAKRNERIKAKAEDKNNQNLIEINDKGINNIKYTPRALADPSSALIRLSVGKGGVKQIDYNGIDYGASVPEASSYYGDSTGSGTTGGQQVAGKTSIGSGHQKQSFIGEALDVAESTRIGSFISNAMHKTFPVQDLIAQSNIAIKEKAARRGSTIQKQNLAMLPAKQASERMITKEEQSDLLLTSSNYDFINDALFSGKQLSGIYGFMADLLGGSSGKRVKAQSADKMSSFKRGFWDANLGGIGGEIMEISRRFFPHDDHSWTEINNIRNTMPDWMPERFMTGDPYVKLPKGEMRLPGKGYESVHKLHSDMYGRYGAIDRMNILADIAPWSDEYKIWRDAAKSVATSAKDKKEIMATQKRVEQQSKAHDFFNYKFLGVHSEIDKITVKQVSGTTVTDTQGKQYSLAGVKLKDKNALSDILHDGMEIRVEHLSNNDDSKPISSAFYLKGENINKQIINEKMGERQDDGSIMATRALTGPGSQAYGAIMEAITHAPIPFIHSKVMKIDTPLEAYKNERLYGTPYSTWEHPIKGFVTPALQKSWARGVVGQGVGLGAWYLAEKAWKNSGQLSELAVKNGLNLSETGINRMASIMFNTANPGAFIGSMITALPTGLMNSDGISKSLLSSDVFKMGSEGGIGRVGARLGAATMIAGFGFAHSNNPFYATGNFALAGAVFAKHFEHPSFGAREGAIAGAVAGFALSAYRNPSWDKEKMFGTYIPKATRKRWDIDEYYDRLTYIKYEGLYKKAMRKAKFHEHVNVEKMFLQYEEAQRQNEKSTKKLMKRLNKISNSNLDGSRKQFLTSKLTDQMNRSSIQDTFVRGGKYTKAAIAYKQAAESTLYGLKDNATMQQVLRAIPKGDKDFFMEFIKEKDKKKRKQILKHVSPYERRALQIAWGEKHKDKVESNNNYFKNHFMPGVFWAGWSPQVNLDNVKIKTIENEGMLLSDFGVYESQKDEPDVMMSPNIQHFDKGNKTIMPLQAKLQSALQGTGLLGVKVTVSPTNASGIEVVANVMNSAKITQYKVQQAVNSFTGTRMFY